MEPLLQDLRYAARTLRKSPGFTAIVMLTLALGIGAVAAIFSVVNGVLLRPLPYSEQGHLVRLYETFPWPGGTEGQGSVSVPNFRDWRGQAGSFEELAAYSYVDVNLQGTGDPERLFAVAGSANLFGTLEGQPLLGRTFLPGEDEPGAPNVAVLSEGLWRRRFGAQPSLIGEAITLDGEPFTVIGVMPADFRFPVRSGGADLWVPLRFEPGSDRSGRGSHWFSVIGRLAPGVDLAAAQAEMNGIAARLEAQYPDAQEGRGIELVSLAEDITGDVRPVLLILLGAAGLVLLIACANAANLMLARSAGRQRDTAIRSALGAGRVRVVRQFLTEALLLALGGAALGLVLAWWGVDVLLALADQRLPRAAEVGFDATVFAFLLLVTILAAIGCGLVPALRASGVRLNDALKEGSGKASIGPGGQRFRGALVVGQMALSLILLIGAGLLMKTFLALMNEETGMRTENVFTLNVSVPPERNPEGGAADRFYRPALERVRELPGVSAAGWITLLPLQEWGMNGNFVIEGRPPAENPNEEPFAEQRGVSPGYFDALGIPVLGGRDLTARDIGDAPPVVLINQALAERYFPSEDPIGRRLLFGDQPVPIVGVVGDVRQAGLDREPMPEIYFPYSFAIQFGVANMALVTSTRVPPAGMANEVRAAIRDVDPDQPVYNVQTMEEVVAGSISDRRLYLWLMGSLAAVALALAVAGIYGVISYAVAQRTREFGIRIALGAATGSVLGLVVRQGAVLAGISLLIGVPLAFLLSRLLTGLLYGVSAGDPLTYGGVALLLTGVALVASYLPARRATRVDPTVALRQE